MELITCLVLLGTFTSAVTELVNTPSGLLRGKVVDFDNEVIHQFLSIPYAKSPVGPLRFRKPQPFGSWSYTIDATKYPPSCVQTIDPFFEKILPTLEISEDCLFLNIYVPRDVSLSKNRAVMVFIHGGGFFNGQASMYDGSELALKGDVIVVTINYRVGLFGFLTTEDSASPGNYGLWDQRLALEWVRSNIAAFGGNPSSITIFGESAGGMSVVYQSIIPYNRGLFQRAIAQSGDGNMLSLASGAHKRTTKTVRDLSGCGEYENTFTFVNCLRHLSTDKIRNVTNTIFLGLMNKLQFDIIIGPCVDGDLFEDDPPKLLNDVNSNAYKFFQSLDFISGITEGEGTVYVYVVGFISASLGINATEGLPTSFLCDTVAPAISESFYDNSSAVSEAICIKLSVPDGNTNVEEQGVQIADLLGDLMFVRPTVKTLKQHSKNNYLSKTYKYFLTTFIPLYIGPPIPWYKKSPHGTDIVYLFGGRKFFYILNMTYSEQDQQLVKTMISYWSNFAKTGNPNSDGLPSWPQFDNKDKAYVNLDHTISAKKDLYPDRINFLEKELPDIAMKDNSKDAGREEL